MGNFYKVLNLLVIFTAFAVSAHAQTATLEAIGGAPTVAVKRAGQTLNLKAGDALQEGDELTTGRSVAVDIRLPDKTLLRLGANSSYKLEAEAGQDRLWHRLLTGVVRVLVPKGDKQGQVKFRMKTPEGTIGVRGTEFVVTRSTNLTNLKGLEGEVLFGPADANPDTGGGFVKVAGGVESSISRVGGAPSLPKAFALDSYLQTLERGPFAPLAKRGAERLRKRADVAKASAPANPAPVPAPATRLKAGKHEKPAPVSAEKAAALPINERLLLASSLGDLKLAGELLAQGAKVNFFSAQADLTVLQAAVVANKAAMVKFLLQKGADVNAQNSDQHTALMLAALEGGDPSVAMALLDAKAKVLDKDSEGWTAAAMAREKAKKDPKLKELADVLTEAEEEALGTTP